MKPPEASRFIRNPWIGREAAGGAEVTGEWLASQMAKAVEYVRASGSEEEGERGPYTGPSGVLLAMHQANRKSPGVVSQNELEAVASRVPAVALHSHRFASPLCGCLGDAAALALAGGREAAKLPAILERAAEAVLDTAYPDEVLYGRAGFLLTIHWLSKLGLAEAGRVSETHLSAVVQAIYTSGRRTSRNSGQAQPPLRFAWHETEYLGAAHGYAGICMALLVFRRLLSPNQLRDLLTTADWLLSLEEGGESGHWESSLDHVGSSRDKALIHWCHGAPGVLAVALAMHSLSGDRDDRYLAAAERAGEWIWQRGVLKKGPGLCHGLAGNGHALLALHQDTGQLLWLHRAHCFALLMMDPAVIHQQRRPDCPGSLFEGWAGALHFLSSLFSPEEAVFPFFPYSID